MKKILIIFFPAVFFGLQAEAQTVWVRNAYDNVIVYDDERAEMIDQDYQINILAVYPHDCASNLHTDTGAMGVMDVYGQMKMWSPLTQDNKYPIYSHIVNGDGFLKKTSFLDNDLYGGTDDLFGGLTDISFPVEPPVTYVFDQGVGESTWERNNDYGNVMFSLNDSNYLVTFGERYEQRSVPSGQQYIDLGRVYIQNEFGDVLATWDPDGSGDMEFIDWIPSTFTGQISFPGFNHVVPIVSNGVQLIVGVTNPGNVVTLWWDGVSSEIVLEEVTGVPPLVSVPEYVSIDIDQHTSRFHGADMFTNGTREYLAFYNNRYESWMTSQGPGARAEVYSREIGETHWNFLWGSPVLDIGAEYYGYVRFMDEQFVTVLHGFSNTTPVGPIVSNSDDFEVAQIWDYVSDEKVVGMKSFADSSAVFRFEPIPKDALPNGGEITPFDNGGQTSVEYSGVFPVDHWTIHDEVIPGANGPLVSIGQVNVENVSAWVKTDPESDAYIRVSDKGSVTSITELVSDEETSVFYSNGQLVFRQGKPVTGDIFDMSGRSVMNFTGPNVSVSNLSSGLYLVFVDGKEIGRFVH
jgi:hypothetical protein